MHENKSRQRDHPLEEPVRLRERLGRFCARWGADLLLTGGAAAVAAGAALVYLPAGWIAGGVLAIIGGVLAARGGGDGR